MRSSSWPLRRITRPRPIAADQAQFRSRHRRVVYNQGQVSMLPRIGLCLAFVVCVITPGSFAQPPAPAPSTPSAEPSAPPIRVEVNEVIVPVTVTDDKGKFISNHEKKDFEILENGKSQTI